VQGVLRQMDTILICVRHRAAAFHHTLCVRQIASMTNESKYYKMSTVSTLLRSITSEAFIRRDAHQ
jgi:hypothetical protein